MVVGQALSVLGRDADFFGSVRSSRGGGGGCSEGDGELSNDRLRLRLSTVDLRLPILQKRKIRLDGSHNIAQPVPLRSAEVRPVLAWSHEQKLDPPCVAAVALEGLGLLSAQPSRCHWAHARQGCAEEASYW